MLFSILSTAVTLASIPAALADIVITIDPSSKWGTWEGWGTSLAWWAKAFGDRDDLASAFFSTQWQMFQGNDLPGLGFNIARYNAGASSHKSHNGMAVSPNIKPSRQIEGFWQDGASPDPSSSSWDWSVDTKQRMMLHKAKKRGAYIFELFSNSPMWWMCGNHNPSGNGLEDNLPSKNYKQHAIYMATVDQHARQNWGIEFQSVEPFNEPSSSWGADGTQEGCHFEVGAMDQVTALLKAELSKRGSRSFIAASDETSYDAAISTWGKMQSATKAAINRINVHGYQGGGGRRDTLYSLAKQYNKALWNSEYGDEEGTGRRMAMNLLMDFFSLHPTAWSYWQAVDGGGWGLIAGDNDAKSLTNVNTKYFVLAQFSRHIRPGMTMLGSNNPNTVAAWNPKNRVLAIVAGNWGPAQVHEFDLSKFKQNWKDGDLVKTWTTVVDGSKKYQREKNFFIQGTRFRSWLEKDSVQTFEIRGVTLSK
ncbi:Endo-beta-1 6-galactanase [Epichloe festucae Fl1]|uniref:Endo-beta-1 6-galactanase n=1 Tax=Epichloe festucae (strain Fl1) TaxID=877507 RepID=A0A7S9KTM8_EPIFF|nr:Endo-beta-1 6-galactanase [Epichloe festucae Fl1]